MKPYFPYQPIKVSFKKKIRLSELTPDFTPKNGDHVKRIAIVFGVVTLLILALICAIAAMATGEKFIDS